MIGFNALGQLGRLGNQMFQYAATKGIAKNCGYNYCIPPSRNLNEWTDHQLTIPFEMSSISEFNFQFIDSNRPTILESKFSFDENIFNHCPDWATLQGFFQTEKYFINVRNELLLDFKFKSDILNPAKQIVSSWRSPVALHIRRGDYITNPNHSVLPIQYYEEALSHFDSNRDVIIFSDDPNWCISNEIFRDDRFLVSQTENHYMDLCLYSLCDSHIIANSSFSWWGAWLSNNCNIIAPKNWFENSNNQHLSIEDLIPEKWEKI